MWLGSRAWRQAADEDFTLAVPEQQVAAGTYTQSQNHNKDRAWNETPEAVCERLLTAHLSERAETIKDEVRAVMATFPLYCA